MSKVIHLDPVALDKWRALQKNPNASLDDLVAVIKGPQPTLEDWVGFLLDQHPDESEEWVKEQAEDALEIDRDNALYDRVLDSLPYAPPKDSPLNAAWLGMLHETLRAEWKRQRARAALNGQARFTPLDQFLLEQDEEVEWLAEGIIPLDALIQFLGKLESFKSMAMLGLHVACSYGSQWLGRDIEAMPSYYVSGEKRRRSIRNRLWHMTQAEAGPQQKDLVIVHRGGLKIDPGNDQFKRLVDEVASGKERALVSFDTITTLAPPGFNENSGESWAIVLDAMRMLTDLPEPATVAGAFHPSKADLGGVGMQSRGHTSFGGEADGALIFNRPNRKTDIGTIHVRPKDGAYVNIPFFWDPESYRITPKDLTGLPLTNDTLVTIVTANGPCDFETIWNAYGYDEANAHRFGEDKVRAVLKAAIEAGAIESERANANQKTQYFIPEAEEE